MDFFTFENFISAGILIAIEGGSYAFAKFLGRKRHAFCPALKADEHIPFIPMFAIIYFGCFATWFLFFMKARALGAPVFSRLVVALLLGYLIGAIIFVLFPTEKERPPIKGRSFSSFLMQVIYFTDSPRNLLPSMHCFMSWMCFAALRGTATPSWQIGALLCAILVFASVLFVKQHFILDIISGVALAELTWALASLPAVYL